MCASSEDAGGEIAGESGCGLVVATERSLSLISDASTTSLGTPPANIVLRDVITAAASEFTPPVDDLVLTAAIAASATPAVAEGRANAATVISELPLPAFGMVLLMAVAGAHGSTLAPPGVSIDARANAAIGEVKALLAIKADDADGSLVLFDDAV